MIHFCACLKRPASTLKLPRSKKASKSCKTCGGKLSVDGRHSLPESMLGTVGPELSRAIDPHLNWKTSTKCRRSAVRRARTSFSGVTKVNFTARSSKERDELTDKGAKKTVDMPVSESEKLGVSILGRRFGDTLESVPIKKRRFLVVRSPSPPRKAPSHLGDSEYISDNQFASCHGTASEEAQQVLDINSDVRMEFDQEGTDDDERTNMDAINDKLYDNVDFSGISILAAAACNSNMAGEILNTGVSDLKGHSLKAEVLSGASIGAELNFACEEMEQQQHNCSQYLDGKTDVSLEISTASVLPSSALHYVGLDGSIEQEKSMSSSQDDPNGTRRVGSSSCNDRLHWDLNTVMDAWEGNCDEVVLNSEALASDTVGGSGNHDEQLDKIGTCHSVVGFGDDKDASGVANRRVQLPKDVCALQELKVQIGSDYVVDNSVADYHERKKCLSVTHGDSSVKQEHRWEDAGIALMVDIPEEMKALHKQESRFGMGVSSLCGGYQEPLRESLANSSVFEEKAEDKKSHDMEVANITSENTGMMDPQNPGKPHSGVAQSITEILTEKKIFVSSVADLDYYSADCCLNDVPMNEATCSRSPCVEEHASSCTDDSGIAKISQCQLGCPSPREASNVEFDGNFCKTNMSYGGIPGEILHSYPLDHSSCDGIEKFKEVNTTTCLLESHTFTSPVLSNHDDLPSGSTQADKCQTPATNLNIEDKNFSQTADDTATVHSGNVVSMTNGMTDAPSLEGVLSSHAECKSLADGHERSSHEVASAYHFDSDYGSDESHTNTGQAVGMERVELRDNDYQYEDGEFRELLLYSWGEEGENEHVDYGSDNRETDAVEGASDFPAVSLPPGGMESKNQKQVDDGQDHHDGKHVRNNVTQDAVCETILKFSSITHGSETDSARQSVENGIRKARGHTRIKEGPKVEGSMKNLVESDEGKWGFHIEGDGTRDSSQLANLRVKSSGWDRLPEACRSSGDRPGESMRTAVHSPQGKGLSSRSDRPKSSDMFCRKDILYSRANSNINSEDERDDSTLSIRRDGSSLHGRTRLRGDRWVASSNHWRPGHHDSPVYHGTDGFTHPGSNNAVAVTTAKLESNGFVVARDGTIIKAGVSKGSGNASSRIIHCSPMQRVSPVRKDEAYVMPLGLRNSRQMSPEQDVETGQERAGIYGPRVAGLGHREWYHRPLSDGSRRDRSFSSHKSPHVSRSQTRSPSRSRTRSPFMWASPRGRSDGRMNGGPSLRRRSRSPRDFKSEPRLERMKLPHQQHGFVERMVRYSPESRDRTSPIHSSRWIDERKHEYVRSLGRTPTKRVFSQSHRLDSLHSPRRMKPDEYHHAAHSGRFIEVAGKIKDSRHDRYGDGRRRHGHNHEMLHSVRQYDGDANSKRFLHNGEDGFRVHNHRPKISSELGRRSPGGFDPGIKSQLGDSRLDREEKGRLRYGRDENS